MFFPPKYKGIGDKPNPYDENASSADFLENFKTMFFYSLLSIYELWEKKFKISS